MWRTPRLPKCLGAKIVTIQVQIFVVDLMPSSSRKLGQHEDDTA